VPLRQAPPGRRPRVQRCDPRGRRASPPAGRCRRRRHDRRALRRSAAHPRPERRKGRSRAEPWAGRGVRRQVLLQGKPRADHHRDTDPDRWRDRGVPEHLVQMAYALRLAQRPGLRELGRSVHMLGFRGHFVTKSRGYSTKLGELRAACAAYRARQHEPTDDDDDDDNHRVVGLAIPRIRLPQPRRRTPGSRRRSIPTSRPRSRARSASRTTVTTSSVLPAFPWSRLLCRSTAQRTLVVRDVTHRSAIVEQCLR
jgi:hypothetical protein